MENRVCAKHTRIFCFNVCVRKRELAVLQVEWHCVYPCVRAQVRAQNVRTPFPDVAASEIRRNQGQRPKGELVGADLVLAATRLAFGQTHWLGLDLPGAAFALVGGDLAGGAAGICRTRLGGVLC